MPSRHVTLTPPRIPRLKLAAQIAQQDDATKSELMQAISTLQGLINTSVEVPKVDDSDFQNSIA
ncbi:MAG: hypothetical protein AAF757_29130, partial [Cyanobacteria bacterium P01_D01_bin.116]